MGISQGLGAFAQGFAGGLVERKAEGERRAANERADRMIEAQLEISRNNMGAAQAMGALRSQMIPLQPQTGGIAAAASGTGDGLGVRPSSGGGGGKPSGGGGNRQQFIAEMMPHAQRIAQRTGLDPRLIIAQAAQETGWGRSAPGNNYFGIKSHGKSGGNRLATNEVVNGQTVRVRDSFRSYSDMGASADGYAEFLRTNPRYKAMLAAGDLDGQLAALGRSGYATDPNYASTVGSIARSITLPGTPQKSAGPAAAGTGQAAKRVAMRADYPAYQGVPDSQLDRAIRHFEQSRGAVPARGMGVK